MTIKLMNLPYAQSALEPAISATTIAVHYGKHHKAYVEKTNELAANANLEKASLNDIVIAAAGMNPKLYNQAAQVWNHGFYWHSLSPDPVEPDAALSEAIESAFASREALIDQLIEKGAAHFGSGWIWLVADEGRLTIRDSHDAACALTEGGNPLLVLDVWEHAYYLDRKNDRKAYLGAAAGLLNWTFASENFARGAPWEYPE